MVKIKDIIDLLDKKCKQPSGFFAKLSFDCNNSDIYLKAQDCLEHNIADDIGALNSVLRMSDKEIMDKCNKRFKK